MSEYLDISVLIPTYNRAEILRETLEAICQVDRAGLAVEFVVIDNNSSDHTKAVVESFTDRLPLRYLFEPRPGKNRALNKALDEVKLGDIVVFADDDVSPYVNWLIAVHDSCTRWPDDCVFGGRVEANWPGGKPEWINERWGSHLSLGDHDQGSEERELPFEDGVSGANMWIRSKVFEEGSRFDERIGPQPKNRIAGSERSFQIMLRRDGHRIIYVPGAIVRHRPELRLRGHWAILKRAWSYGRGVPLMLGIPNMELFQRSPSLWHVQRLLAMSWAVCRLVLSCARLRQQKRIGKSVEPTYDIAYNIEAMRLAKTNNGRPII